MKKIYSLLFFLFVILRTNAQFTAPQWTWAKDFASTGWDVGHSVTTDAAGYVYIAGEFGGPSIGFSQYTVNGPGLYVAKINPSGTARWAKGLGGYGGKAAYSVSADHLGNLYVVGMYNDSVLIVGNDTLRNTGFLDNIFISKFDTSGNVLWTRGVGGTGEETARSVKVDLNGNAYVTGEFSSPSISFDSFVLNNAGQSDAYVAKYNSNGIVIWAQSFGGTRNEFSNSVTVDNTGNIYFAGDYSGPTATFGSYTLNASGTATNAFVSKLDQTTGNVLWALGAGAINIDEANSVATDSLGNVFLAGNFQGPAISFGSVTLNFNIQSNTDMFIVKFDSNGNAIWGKQSNNPNFTVASTVIVKGSNDIYLGGCFQYSTIPFGNTILTNYVPLNLSTDIFLTKYDGNGNIVWAKGAPGGGDDKSLSLALDQQSNVYVTGFHSAQCIYFDALPQLCCNDQRDVFLAKIPCGQSTTSANEFENVENISIYPNPTYDKINIHSFRLLSSTEISIENTLGQNILTKSFEQFKNTIFDLSENPAGIYFVKVKSGNVNTTKKIILIR